MSPRGGLGRLLPWLAFGVASLLGVALLERGDPEAPEGPAPSETPPLTASAAEPWLVALAAGGPMRPEDPRWRPMVEHLGVVSTWRDALLAKERTPTEAWALAVFGQDPAWLGLVAEGAGLPVDLAAVLLLPAAETSVAAACPGLSGPLSTLCRSPDRDAAVARLDASLGSWLGSRDPFMSLWSLEAACGLGPQRGPALGDRLESGAVPVEAEELRLARAILVRGCTLPRPEAVTFLQQRLQPGSPEALVAATELARLGGGGSTGALSTLAKRLGDTGDAVLVRYAADLVAGKAAHFDVGIPTQGL